MPDSAKPTSPKNTKVVAAKRHEKVMPTTLKAPAGSSAPRPSGVKEQEPGQTAAQEVADIEEKKLMAEIRTTAEAADKQALEAIKESVAEVKRGHFEPELPADVEDAGVVNPQKAAESVVVDGPKMDLPFTEEAYQKGLKSRVSGKSDNKKVVRGVSSIAALAIFIGRVIKLAHKHTMRIVFKGGKDAN